MSTKRIENILCHLRPTFATEHGFANTSSSNQPLKVALVTGAGSGIGRHVTLALLQQGFAVVLAGRRKEALDGTIQLAKSMNLMPENDNQQAHPRSWCVPTNVSSEESVRELFVKIKSLFGRLDLLFNNAGVAAPPVPIEDLPFEKWREVVDVNLTGVFLCARAAIKLMKEQRPMGGRIINNGSVSAHSPRPNSAPYTATKHAVTGLTKSISLDGRKYNIACGQIDIGNAASDMTKKMSTGVAQANGTTAVEPTMDVNNVAKTIALMASLPLDTNVQFVTIMATAMPLVGRG